MSGPVRLGALPIPNVNIEQILDRKGVKNANCVYTGARQATVNISQEFVGTPEEYKMLEWLAI